MPILVDSLIFDLDGTLWDSSHACASGWNQALFEMGKKARNFSPADIGAIMGLPPSKIFEKFFPEESPEERSAIASRCLREELKSIQETTIGLFPGVKAGLITLAQTFPLYLVSNCLTDYLETFFTLSGLKPLFKDSTCHGATGKTKAENISLIIANHHLKSAAYIGDTAADHKSAERAGALYFHVNYGFGTPDRECQTFDTFSELVSYFTTL